MFRSLLGIALTLATSTAVASVCGPQGCPTMPQARQPQDLTHAAIARVRHKSSGGVSYGSGTLIGNKERASWFLTCAHLFDEGKGITEVYLPGQNVKRAEIVGYDRPNDLALLRTEPVSGKPATLSRENPSNWLTACGYGSQGKLRCLRGRLIGYAQPQGTSAPSLRMRGAMRPGDSGGPVFNERGELVAVVWGVRDNQTFATYGRPIRQILARWSSRESSLQPVLPRQPAQEPKANDSQRPTVGIQTPSPKAPVWGRVANKIGATDLFLAGLGLGGPIGVAILFGKYWLNRRIANSRGTYKHPIAVDTPPPPQQVVHETHYVPYERDSFAAAHQWACEQLARKFPGSVELLTCLDSLIKQALAGKTKPSVGVGPSSRHGDPDD